MNLKNIGIIGAGGWGSALAILLAQRCPRVLLWGNDPEHIAQLRDTRRNDRYLPGIDLPEAIAPTAELNDLAACDLVLFVTPSKAIRSVANRFAAVNPNPDAVLLSCTKGIEFDTGARMSQILAEVFPANHIAVLSGPSHAEEVARMAPTAVVIGCSDQNAAEALQEKFSGSAFRAYTSCDVAGIELGGALKNIFAIGAGVSDGLGLGDNTKAALVTRSLAELIRLGTALGGRRETFQGLSGIGDLMVTCFSRHSRNRSVGERIGKGESLEQITNSMHMVAEGVPTCKSAYQQAHRLGIQTPIIDQLHRIMFDGISPREALVQLLNRDPRPEED